MAYDSLKTKPANYGGLFTPPKISDVYKSLFPGVTPTPSGTVPFSSVTRTLPGSGDTYESPVVAPTVTPTPTKSTAIVPPSVETPSTQTLDYSKYTDPVTGKVLSPAEYANMLAQRATAGAIPAYAGDSATQGPQTTEQLTQTARDLNNNRNDIATGETDPYKSASKSGIAYNPTEMAAIEKAYAGIYDPALKDVFAKLESKQKEEADAAALKNDLAKMAKQHEYDIDLKSIVSSGNSNQMTDNERAAQTLFQCNPIVKDYNTVVNQKNTIDRLISNGVGGPADVSAIFTFMKALDPNSVVRESEYDKAAASGNLFQGAWTKFNGYFKDKGGILPENVRQEFQNLIKQKLVAQGASYKNLAERTKEIAKRQGMNPDNVVIDFTGGLLDEAPKVTLIKDGQSFDASDLSADELKQALADGYVQQ